MNKTPLKRTSLVLMSLFAGFALVGCNPYNAQFHPDSVGYNGEIGAGAQVMGAGGSSGGGASGGPNAGPTTTTSLNALQTPALNAPKIICDGQDTCPKTDDVFHVVVNGADVNVNTDFAEKLKAADAAAGKSSAPPPSNQDTDGNSSSQTPPEFYYGINGFINGGGKDITFDASSVQNLSGVTVVIGADVYNAKDLHLNTSVVLAGDKINGNLVINPNGNVTSNSTINGNVTNDGTFRALYPLGGQPFDIVKDAGYYPRSAANSNSYVQVDKTHIALVPPVTTTINGDFTQKSDGYYVVRLGTMRVNGTATVDGTVNYNYTPDPRLQNDLVLLMVSPNEIKTSKTLQANLATTDSDNPAIKEIDKNYFMSSIIPPIVKQFNMGGVSFYGLFAFTSGVPVDLLTADDFLNTFSNNTSTLACNEACPTTETDKTTNTADALATALPTQPMGTIQAYGGIQVPNTLFTQDINDPTKEVTFNAVSGGVGGVVFDGALTLKTLNLDYNTRTFFNGNTVTGNVVLDYSQKQETDCSNDKSCNDSPPLLITQGVIVGNVTNNYGQVMVVQSAKEMLYAFWGYGNRQAYLLNFKPKDEVIPIISFPVGLVVEGNYTQQGLYNVNLNIKSGVMLVDGQVDIQSGVIVQSYTPLQYSDFFNLLILSTHPIKVASKGVFYGHIAKTWVSDSAGIPVMLTKGIYALVNKFHTSNGGSSSSQSYEAKTQTVSARPKMSSLANALSHVKAPVINAKVLDQEGHVTARTVRVAGSSPLLQLRQTLMEASTEQSDTLEGKGVVRLQEANAATRLFLDNNSVFGLLNGVNVAPAKASSLRFDVGVDNDVLFGQKQRLANSTVLHAAVASGPVVGRVAVNYVAMRQNTQLTDNVKADELSHSKGYGVNAGVQYQLPGAQGWAIAANVGFEYFNNTLNLGDKKKPAYDTSVLSTTVLASNRYTLGALQAKNDVLALTPFVGYRFARQSTKRFNYSLDSYTFTSKDQAQMSNSLVAGATVQYANAFGVQGLQLGADLALDVALNNKVDHELSVMGTAFSVAGKLNSAFTAQTALSVGYKLSNVQFGAKVQLQVNSNVQGSVGGFASVSF